MRCFYSSVFLAMTCLVAVSGMLVSPAQAEVNGSKKIVFVAGPKSHGYGAHEHYAGCKLLAKCLKEAVPDLKCVVTRNGFPADMSVFDDCDAVVIFSDGGGRHPAIPHLQELDALAEKGVGIACLHYAVEIPKGEPGDALLKWTGGYFEAYWSINPFWVAKFTEFPKHPITRGVKPFEINDEWYYHMRFRPDMEGVTPLLSDLPGPETLTRRDGAHSNNPDVRAAVLEREEPQHLAWASESSNGQRGFGFTGGHYHWNWATPSFLRIVLNGIAWIARIEVPAGGIPSDPVTLEALLPNQDFDQPGNFDADAIRKQFHIPVAATGAAQ